MVTKTKLMLVEYSGKTMAEVNEAFKAETQFCDRREYVLGTIRKPLEKLIPKKK